MRFQNHKLLENVHVLGDPPPCRNLKGISAIVFSVRHFCTSFSLSLSLWNSVRFAFVSSIRQLLSSQLLPLWTYIGTQGELYCLCTSSQFLLTNTIAYFNNFKIAIVVSVRYCLLLLIHKYSALV